MRKTSKTRTGGNDSESTQRKPEDRMEGVCVWGGGGGGTVQTVVVRIGYSKSAENQYVNNVNLKIGWGGGGRGGHSSNGGG